MSTSTFSYAQAAKGQLATQSVSSQQSPSQSQTPSVAGNQSRDANNTTNVSTRAPSIAVSISSNDIDSSPSARSTSAKPEPSRSNGTDVVQEDNTIPPVAGSLGASKAGADAPAADGVANAAEQRGRSSNTGSDSGEHYEGKKGRKPKKGKSAEKESEAGQESGKEGPPPKVELSEAPVPTVNFWVQRQQQAAKTKNTDQPSTTAANASQTPVDTKVRSPPSQSEAVESNKAPFSGKHTSKRDGDLSRSGTNQGPRRAAPRGARAQEKEPETNLLANNPASWPTPETAAVNLKTQPHAQAEKPEKEDKEDASAAKPRQKKEWVQLPNFVPTVKFETALPGRGPRGGRVGGARGGRDATGTHHHTPHATDRAQEGGAGPRANAGSRRAQMEGSGPREGRKNAPHAEHSKIPKESVSDHGNGEQPKPNQVVIANGVTQEQPGQGLTPNQREENVAAPESHKEARAQSNRDAHPRGQNGPGHRGGERTRGGGRGRGAFNPNNSNGMHHHPQHPYTTQHHAYPFPPNNTRHMTPYGGGYQVPYSFPGQPGPGQRKSTGGSRRQGSGRAPQPMPPIGVPYDNMYAPPSNAIYQYDAGNLLHLAQSQVEYYFSVENCVKDWFLRTHMDSQGFVPIEFIARFNRMRELLVDLNVLRQACIDSPVLELVMGNDGVERVRSKEGWEKWVIPDMSLRDPSARHDGPSTWQKFGNAFPSMMAPHYPVDAPPVFPPGSEHNFVPHPNGNFVMPPLNVPTLNGMNGVARPLESQLSAAVPEFSPSNTTFNGLKSSQKETEDTKNLANKEINGVVSSHEQSVAMANGVVHSQPQTSLEGSHATNGVDATHENAGH
ncbi:hypothetical protein GGR50DRAFT_27253 [Xylaria sp. CBS 124048]|nr:hypothetical protein GGR50DRAFT_27253 [Xylaria sp. CBS 124048]